ncbi:acyl-CoA dehydrogenase family protein [Skermania piniformis]|uniref:Acyl-CoA/acyl-ACP dehydrogenase n=1 Tax=Skermania pinensis TaxID=39122 RepID=A0ABX8S7X1_9ACTN|nr:acyl-CoA dehydrogenase family protein [Skermania piniformis]QXQ13556.1 acyl-CoA/acyl-ACP dehydrogenase [Skermania piniformis]
MTVITDEQRALTDSVRGLLARHAGPAAVRAAIDTGDGYDHKLWRLLCDQIGVAALAIPEEFGGVGAGLSESHTVLAELGAVLAPTPMLGAVALATQAILAAGDDAACGRLLPDLAEGARTAALCWAGRTGWAEPDVVADGSGTLTGTAEYVLDGEIAEVLIVIARTPDGLGLFEVVAGQDGVRREVIPGMDLTRRYTRVRFDGVAAGRLGTGDATAAVDRIRDIGWAALAAEQVGAAARCLELTVEYTKARVQFGRPIGSFQALKHRMADLYVQVEAARSISAAATAALDAGSADARADVSAARRYCSETFSAVTAEMIQLHGGIAITWEHDAHLYFKRAHADAHLLR